MKKIFLILNIIALPIFLYSLQEFDSTYFEELKEKIKAEQDPQKLKALFLSIYDPTANNCGAAITSTGKKTHEQLKYLVYGDVACLLAGQRFMILIQNYERDFGNFDTFKKMLKQNGLDYIQGYPVTRSAFFVFNKKGKKNALFIKKANEEEYSLSRNGYLLGKILGYKEEDIEAFFLGIKKFSIAEIEKACANLPKTKEAFEKVKKQAEEWFAKHEAEVQSELDKINSEEELIEVVHV